MKVTALIIATYISLLTVQPMLSVLAAMKNNETVECCGNKSCENEQPQKKNNKSEQHSQCNPFQTCSLCCGYFVSEFAFKNIVFGQSKFKHRKYIENKKSTFFASYFHPPEIV